jgi:predicted short-subunit dehydrogenase-like oxidoreductase (DUF2520 family)
MKRLELGLIVEGNSTSSAILRLSSVCSQLGPVKAGSLQVARRVSNFLRSGYGVNTYDELAGSRIILIRVPDASVPKVVAELCESELDLSQFGFVLCETWMQTEALQPLKQRGAAIASLVAASETRKKIFAVEGDTALVRQVRRIVESSEVETVEVRAGAKHLLYAATILLTSIPVPVFVCAQQALRESGISGNQLATLLGELAASTLAGFLRGAKGRGLGPLAGCPPETSQLYMARLRASNPDLAGRIDDLINWANAASVVKQQEVGRGHSAS